MKSSPNEILLQAQFTSLSGVSKQVCVAHVIVGQGLIHSCTIIGETGTLLLHQHAAYEALARCGEIDWQVFPAPRSLGARSQGAWTGTLGHLPEHARLSRIPTLRVSPLPRETLMALPHSSRVALVLVDGKRSLMTIAHLLKKTPQEIQQIFAHVPHLVSY